ncbi:MAG: hypothetical protein Q9208_000258 [Pyrenodesmia sp. 3 TL-2023]
MAGSATTAVVLKMAVVFVVTHPSVLERLLQEIDKADEAGLLSQMLQFKEAKHLPYLTAILNETLRLRAPQITPIPRVVPKGGAEICGYHLPEGTLVAALPWSFQARSDLFGPDVRAFRPERWLEDEEQTRMLHKSSVSFGKGSTSCVGKNVADVEMTKFLVQLFREYTVVLQDPLKPSNKVSRVTIDYINVKVRLTARKRA